jgi:hypothetical protein
LEPDAVERDIRASKDRVWLISAIGTVRYRAYVAVGAEHTAVARLGLQLEGYLISKPITAGEVDRLVAAARRPAMAA